MKIKYSFFFFLVIFCAKNSIAQKHELGNVTIEELNQKTHPIDSSASAAILFKTGETRYVYDRDGSWSILTEVKFKIKIYKKEGLEFANKSVNFYVGGNPDETINFKNAVTYNLVNGKIEKTKLKSDGEFTEEVNENYKLKKISMPQVKEGSIIEYSYILNSPFILKLDDYYFQAEIPIDYSEYVVYLPEYFIYKSVISGYEKVAVDSKQITTNDFKEVKYTYTIKDVPGIKPEGNIININNYTSVLKYELASVQYPNRPFTNISVSWEDVVKTIYDNDNFGKQLNTKSYFEQELDIVLKDAKTENEKIAIVFEFLKRKMTWNERYSVFTRDGVKKAYKQNTGNVAEINLMLVAMLRHAGISANPILLSTRRNGIAIYPNQTAYNYVVAGIEIENDVILLDATHKNAVIDQLPLRAVNWTGRIIRPQGSSNTIDLLRVRSSKENIYIMGEINSEGKIAGKIKRIMTEYNAQVHRDSYGGVAANSYLEKLESNYSGVEIDDYNVENIKELSKPVIEQYSFVDNNSVEIIGNKMYVSPLLFFTVADNPFKLESRKYPVDFNYPYQDSYTVSFKIPEGYEVDFLPKPTNFATESKEINFKYNISAATNTISLVVNFDVHTFFITPDQYNPLKDFYKFMIDKQKEKIILRKKQ